MGFRHLGSAVALCVLVACGGGGSSDQGVAPATPPSSKSEVSVIVSMPTDAVPVGTVRWYDLVVSNAGPDAATDVRVQSTFPLSFSPDHVSCDAAGGATCPALAESMTVPTLPVNGIVRYRVFVRHRDNSPVPVTSTVFASNDNVTHFGQTARFELHAFSADIQVSAVAPTGEVAVGSTVSYAMTVSNAGPDPASNIAIHNFVDANQSLQAIRCTAAGGAVCPTIVAPHMSAPRIPVGGSLRFDVEARSWPTTVGPISNRLQTSALGDPDIYDNSATATARVTLASNPGSLVQLQSDANDFVGQGHDRVYDLANSFLRFDATGSRLDVRVLGDQDWTGTFQLPGGLSQLRVGSYLNLGKADGSGVGGLNWSGEGRGCSAVTGWIIVDQVTYSGATPTLVDLRFEQHCDGAPASVRGRVRWVANDTTQPPPPITPPPADLWRAAPGATPPQGSYAYFRREPFDPVRGSAANQVFTRSDSVLAVNPVSRGLEIRVNGDAVWMVDFRLPLNLSQLQRGYYRGLAQQENPARGYLWSSLQGCDVPRGWLVIDDVTYAAGVLASIDLRFEQYCGTDVSAFRGQVHWVAGETTQPPGPQVAPPGLWAPPAGSTPGSGNYVYVESDAEDYVGKGVTRLFTDANLPFNVTSAGLNGRARVVFDSALGWSGEFVAMNSVPRLVPGLYFGVGRSPFHNPAKGGLDWSGEGRGCNELWGWFVIDNVSYAGDELTALDARFEQHCEFANAALRGKVHWVK